MPLIVPHTGELHPSDARLVRLAQFLGVSYELLFLDREVQEFAGYVRRTVQEVGSCIVVNPEVIKEWTGGTLPRELASCLSARFQFLLVHCLASNPFCADVVNALSSARAHSVRPIPKTGQMYQIAANCRDVCGPFSGISFGYANTANDYILDLNTDAENVRTLISIGDDPFMVAMKINESEMFFIGGTDTADVNEDVGSAPLSDYFSRFVPQAMALRYMFADQCWHPREHHASITIDDPLLRPNYGFLNFESLLRLMKEYNVCTTVAFIPNNYRRSASRVVRMFHENQDRLAICFHGNDHTEKELASSDTTHLNTLIGIAEWRMSIHRQVTGLHCHKVMVFPQEYFSVEAMKVLQAHNFCAAVSSMTHPAHDQTALTLAELAQPAVFRYGGFPLFIRRYIREIKRQDIAFNLFFGRPILIVEHHDIFKRPEALLELVFTVNKTALDIRWCDLETAVCGSVLTRIMPDGCNQVRGYSGTVTISNNGVSMQHYSVEWSPPNGSSSFESVLQNGSPIHSYRSDDCGIRVEVELDAGKSKTLSLTYRNDYATLGSLGIGWNARAYVRRRLSEVRDNYISKSQSAMSLARALQKRVLFGSS